ncbi:hypothetical protein MRX96_044236 [Rhipicephalus microplus]
MAERYGIPTVRLIKSEKAGFGCAYYSRNAPEDVNGSATLATLAQVLTGIQEDSDGHSPSHAVKKLGQRLFAPGSNEQGSHRSTHGAISCETPLRVNYRSGRPFTRNPEALWRRSVWLHSFVGSAVRNSDVTKKPESRTTGATQGCSP